MTRHGEWWQIAEGQDTEGISLTIGKQKPTGSYTKPLRTIEADLEFGPFESVRYFGPMPTDPEERKRQAEIRDFWEGVRND